LINSIDFLKNENLIVDLCIFNLCEKLVDGGGLTVMADIGNWYANGEVSFHTVIAMLLFTIFFISRIVKCDDDPKSCSYLCIYNICEKLVDGGPYSDGRYWKLVCK
jgi:hypothetical protein